MLKVKRVITGIMFCVFFISIVCAVAAAENMFVCDLGVNKIGPKPADTEAQGNVVFYLDESKQELTYKLMVEKIQDVYMAHLHIGPAGKEGQTVAWLYPLPGDVPADRTIKGEFNGILAEGVIRPEDLKNGITIEELLESLTKGNAYVNVHTEKFYMGAIRGQVYSEEFASRMMDENPPAAGNNK